MSIQIKLKNSVVQDSTPSTSDLPEVGELAVNGNINSIGGFMRASDNTIVKIFGPGSVTTPTATTTVSGISELATNTETTTGTATNRVVTPAGLNAVTVAERTTSNNNYVAKAGSTMTGVLQLTAGSTSVPAINFGASNTGIYQASGANNVRIAVDGSDAISASTAGGVNFVPKATALTSLTLGSQSATDKPLFFADAASVESASLLLDNSSNEFRVRNNRFSGKIVFAPSSNVEKARIDNSGKLLVGTSTARTNFFNLASTHTPRFQIESTNDDNGRAALGLIYGKTNASGAYIVLAKHRSNTVGDNTVVQSGDETGIISFQGSDGSQFVDTARIESFVDGTPGADDMPGRLVFSTTADGAASPTTRLTIDSAGLATFAGNITSNGTITSQDITIADQQPRLNFVDNAGSPNDPDYLFQVDGGTFLLHDSTNVADRFSIAANGTLRSHNNHDFSAGIDVTGAITGTGDLTIDTNTLHVDSSNNRVGIGTTSPGQLLSIKNTNAQCQQSLTAATNGSCAIYFGDTDSVIRSTIIHHNTGDYLSFGTAAAERVRINSVGDVGIGTTSPGYRLTVKAASGTDTTALFRSDDANAWIQIRDNTTTDTAVMVGANGDNLLLRAGSNERVRIDSTGKVGIGVTDPTRTIDAHVTDSGANYIHLTNTGTGTGDANGTFIGLDAAEGALIWNQENNYVRFGTNNTERMRIDSSGRLLIGSTSALSHGGIESHLQVLGTGTDDSSITLSRFSNNVHSPYIAFAKSRNGSVGGNTVVQNNDSIGRMTFFGNDGTDGNTPAAEIDVEVDGTPGSNDMPGRIVFRTTSDGASSVTERMRVDSSGDITVNFDGSSQTGQFKIADGSASLPGLTFWADGSNDTGIFRSGANTLNFSTAGSERMRIDSSGDVLFYGTIRNDNVSSALNISGGNGADSSANIILNGSSGSPANVIQFRTGTTERMRIANDGKVGIGDSTPNYELQVNDPSGTVSVVQLTNTTTGAGAGDGLLMYITGNDTIISNEEAGYMRFQTSGLERMRIDSSGNVLVGTTSTTVESLTSAGQGVKLAQSGRMFEVASNSQPAVGFNRTGDDGTIVRLIGQGSLEGTITVSGSTVSYNGGHLSRWSQIKGLSQTDKSDRPTIYQGTVMSNLDDLCVWEGEDNQQLNMTKISDVEGDKDVAGVFYIWDDDDDKVVNDFYIAMTGDLVIRVAASTTVARGDLLISAGDGTAKPQADDIVRSSTIAKIISTNHTATYPDGSKAYPCVLMAC